MPKDNGKKNTPLKKIRQKVIRELQDQEKKHKEMLGNVTGKLKTPPSNEKILTQGVADHSSKKQRALSFDSPQKNEKVIQAAESTVSIINQSSAKATTDESQQPLTITSTPILQKQETLETEPASSSKKEASSEHTLDLTDAERQKLQEYSKSLQLSIEPAQINDLSPEIKKSANESLESTPFWQPKENEEISYRNRQTGYLGEALAFNALQRELSGTHYQINWKNQKEEAGEPFDIEIITPECKKIYYEVKATTQAQKKAYIPCYFTMREVQFMKQCHEEGSDYHVLRIYQVNPDTPKYSEKPTIKKIPNPYPLLFPTKKSQQEKTATESSIFIASFNLKM